MKRRNGFLLFIVVVCLGVPFSSQASTEKDQGLTNENVPYNVSHCHYISHNKPYGYCITQTKGSTNPDILWYMHGVGSFERGWIDNRSAIWKYWHDNGIQAPTVVTISFGPVWLLAEKNGAKASGLFNFVVDSLMPQIEKELGGLKGRRLLIGQSMGGYNAAQLVMKRPQLFSLAAILCPDITVLTPYSSKKSIDAFMAKSGADANHAYWEVVMDRIFYSDDGAWNSSFPLTLGKSALGSLTPPLYISGGTRDQYGFYEGDLALAMLAKSKGVPTVWDTSDGRHCAYNPTMVARFLTSSNGVP